MKIKFVLPFLFLCFVVGLRAQLNEIHTAYHVLNTEDYGKGVSISYFRNLSDQPAIGLHTNFRGIGNKNAYTSYVGSIDNLIAGADFSTSYYHKESKNDYFRQISPTNIRLRLGTRF